MRWPHALAPRMFPSKVEAPRVYTALSHSRPGGIAREGTRVMSPHRTRVVPERVTYLGDRA